MRTVVETVTPELAAQFLEGNGVNRKLRKSWVNTLTRAIQRGEWKTTHQGLAISHGGRLLDGQHRLNAIINAGIPVKMAVTYGVDEAVFDSIDTGARRKVSDILGLPVGVTSAVTEIARITWHEAQPSAQFLADRLYPFIELGKEMMEYAPSPRNGISVGPVRAALLVRMAQQPEHRHYMLEMYRNLVLANLQDLPPVGLSFFRQTLTQKQNPNDWFCLAMKAFDPANRDLQRTFVRDSRSLLEEARDFVKAYVTGAAALKQAA